MITKLLYYPYINIPENSWTIKSILYWDSVGIITPQQFIEYPDRYDSFTRSLLQAGLIEQVIPQNYIYNLPEFDNEFNRTFDLNKASVKRKKLAFKHGAKTKVHVQKTGEKIMEYLVDLKVAEKINWEWFNVESTTANSIILYTASVIGRVGDFLPATDRVINLPDQLSRNSSRNTIRQRLIDDIMPYPITPNLDLLRRFKDDHYQELNSFRILLEQIVLNIDALPKEHLKNELLELKILEIKDKRERILSALKSPGIGKIVFGSICGFAGSLLGISSGAILSGALSFINAAYNVTKGYNSDMKSDEDFAYLALVDKAIL